MTTYGPHWFSMAMGTAMVSITLTGAPLPIPGLDHAAVMFWLLASVLLFAISATALRQHRDQPGLVSRHLNDPSIGHFYGAPAIALLSTGAATLLAGPALLGLRTAIVVDAVLWVLGTLLGLAVALVLPVTAITRHRYDTPDHHPEAIGAWLLPLVCPLVSASTGALLVPHLPGAQLRDTMVLAGYALTGASVLACIVTFAHLWSQLVRSGPGPVRATPLLWIPLGFLGQSVTAFGHLGEVATAAGPSSARFANGFEVLTVLYGVPVWGCALAWLAIALTLTVRALHHSLPFTLAWWSFTFPLGTVVTASEVLAQSTDLVIFRLAAGLLTVALATVWGIVAVRTARLLGPAPRAGLVRAG